MKAKACLALCLMTLVALLCAGPGAAVGKADFQIEEFSGFIANQDGSAALQAAAHPFQITTNFLISSHVDENGAIAPDANPHNIEVDLPAGLVGNPTAVPTCTEAQLANGPTVGPPYNSCPINSQVGVAEIDFTLGGAAPTFLELPVYNMVPPLGSPAMFGMNVEGFVPLYLHTRVRTGSDYGVTTTFASLSQATPFIGGTLTIWGVPTDSAHDPLRGQHCFETYGCQGGGQKSSAPPIPFLTNPSDCAAGPLRTATRIDSWQEIGSFKEAAFLSHLADGTPAGVEGCSRLPFDPSVEVRPTTATADSPMGLNVSLKMPQNEAPSGLAQAYLKKATVTLPPGVTVNPSAANGLVGCSLDQVDLNGAAPAECPNASKIGTVEIETPLLDHPIAGGVYAAAPKDNPFGSLLAIYIAADDPRTGVVIKLAGHVEADPRTGQLTTVVDDAPQLPFSSFELSFFGGADAVLRSPQACGEYTSVGRFSSWSAEDPAAPAPTEIVTSVSKFKVERGPGGACPSGDFAPKLTAGTANPVAADFSAMSLRLTREDGTPELKAVEVQLPPGLLARLADVPYCPDSAIAAAASRSAEGGGAVELAQPSCPAASQIGSVSVGAGAGPNPLYVNSGRVYLAGPYKGAPLSLAIVTPAVAGPFDLGTVVVKAALEVDPESATIRAVTDDLPTILHGIPLALRDVRVTADRPGFVINPTNCAPMAFSGAATALTGTVAPVFDRFQVGSCERLRFRPALRLRLRGGSRRGAYPALRAVLTAGKGQSSIKRVSVALPHSEFLAQEHIHTICTRVQFAADNCPAGSIYGHARAVSPLLAQPLEGPVYLRSSSHALPDLVVALHGQLDIDLVGRIDSVAGGIRTTFESVPDAPVSKFVLRMKGGRKSLLVNSVNICKSSHRATVKMRGQNGKTHNFHSPVHGSCGKRKS